MTSCQGFKLIAIALPSRHTTSAHASPFPSPSPSPSDLHPLPVPHIGAALRPLHHTTRLATDRINDLLKPIGLSRRSRNAVSEIAHGGGGVGRTHAKKGRGGEEEGELDGGVATEVKIPIAQGGDSMLAAVDLGTNSFHMVVVRADAEGRFQIEDTQKEDVRLGSGSSGFSVINPEAEERALAAIQRLKKIAANRKAVMRVVATSAVREAKNRRAFVRKVFETTGVEVEVLSGREEACLIYSGILQALPVFSKAVLTVDIGGGSTEFVLGKEGKPLFATSLKLGHIRLTERFVGSEPLSKAAMEEMRRYIRVALNDSGVLEAVRNGGVQFEEAIGSSGTIETVEQMAQSMREGNGNGGGPESATPEYHEREFSAEELSAVVKRVCKYKTAESRAKMAGLNEKRADVIVGGAILLEEIFLAMGIQKMRVSPYALREGVIVDTLARTCAAFNPTPNLRRASVLNLASKFNVDRRRESALHSAQIALMILAGLQSPSPGGSACLTDAVASLEESDTELLWAATTLHYVGMFVDHKGYHKHSHYIIKNNEHLMGFTPMEVEMIALLARYHRKRIPSMKDEEISSLTPKAQQRLRALVAIIRIAVAMDRCDSSAVQHVHVVQDEEACMLAVVPAIDPDTGEPRDVGLETWAANQELPYFEKVFKRRSSIVVADQPDVENLGNKPESLSLSS